MLSRLHLIKDTQFYVPNRLSLNSECLNLKISTSTNYNSYWEFHFEALCPSLGTFYFSVPENFKADIIPLYPSYVNELLVHFTKDGKPAIIPDLKLYTEVGRNPDNSIAITYLSDNDIYIEYLGYTSHSPSQYFHFNGKIWEWLDLNKIVQPVLNTPHDVILRMNVSDKYLHVYESNYADYNETTLDLFKKGVYRKQFILDRQTFKILWSGVTFEQAGS